MSRPGARLTGDMERSIAHGLGVGGAQARDEVDEFAGVQVEALDEVSVGGNNAPLEVTRPGFEATGAHVLGEGREAKRHPIFGPSHERALTDQAVQPSVGDDWLIACRTVPAKAVAVDQLPLGRDHLVVGSSSR